MLQNIIACDVSNDRQGGLGSSPAERMAKEMFNGSFESCLSMTDADIRSYLKTFSELSQNLGQVRLMPGAQRNIRAFVQFISHRAQQNLPLDEELYLIWQCRSICSTWGKSKRDSSTSRKGYLRLQSQTHLSRYPYGLIGVNCASTTWGWFQVRMQFPSLMSLGPSWRQRP